MASITKRITPAGSTKWRARYRDFEGAEHVRHFDKQKDAKAWLLDMESSIADGTWADPARGKQTVGVMAQTWLASHPDWTPSTRARNESIVRLHINPRWEKVPLANMQPESIQKWVSSIELAPGSVRKIASALTSILDLAVVHRRLGVNPAAQVARPKQPLSRRRYLTGHQLELMADNAGSWQDLVLVLGYTGLRFGELAALRVRDVDLVKRRLNIAASVTEVNGRMEWGDPKDHQRRSVPYPDFLDAAMELRTGGRPEDALVWCTSVGTPLRIGNVRRDWFDAAAKAAGVEGLTPHELRHTAASLAVAAGASVLAVQRMLGHDKPATTLNIYSDLFDDELDDVSARLAETRAGVLADYLRTGRQIEGDPQQCLGTGTSG